MKSNNAIPSRLDMPLSGHVGDLTYTTSTGDFAPSSSETQQIITVGHIAVAKTAALYLTLRYLPYLLTEFCS